MSQIETRKDLEDFVKSVPDLREDFHEASDLLHVGISGWILDNEGSKGEVTIVISDKNSKNQAIINLATLLGIANHG